MSELVSCLRTAEPTAVLLEATGGLEVPLVSALAAAALPVVVVNPRQVRDFAKATGKLAKTDALDAQVLAHFAEAVRPPVRPLRDEDTQELNSLTTRRSQLMTMLVAEKNRLRRASHSVHPSIQSHIRWLEQELSDLDKDLRKALRSSPVWREKDNLLRSVPGVGEQISLSRINRAAAPAQVDQEIYFWGYGGGEGVLRMEPGVVQRISWDDVIADAYAIPGDSGAPVYNEYGHLLGTMSRGNASDRAVFTGDLCGEEATPIRTPAASASSAASANSTPTVERTDTTTPESTATATPVPTSTPTATPTPTSTPTPVSQIVVVQVAQSVYTSTPIPTATSALTSTSTPVPVGVTQGNPIPLGQPGTTHDDFMVSVVEVQKDAHDMIVQSNENKSYYEEPLPGHVYIMVRIKVKNVSSDPQNLSNNRWSVVGQSQLEFGQCRTRGGGFYYSYEVPDEFDDGRLMFQGGEIEGNLCFTVKSVDLESIVMFDKSESNWLFFALQ